MAKSGPVDPVFIAFILRKYFKEKYMGTSWKNLIFGNMRLKNFENLGTYPHSHIAT
jgi:hypothetical protein